VKRSSAIIAMSFKTRVCALLVTLATQAAEALPAATQGKVCPTADSGITLPKDFCATIFADRLGHPRHLVVSADGTVYVNTWSGSYYHNDIPPAGGFLIALKDTKGIGRADISIRFGETKAGGGRGGTGIAIYKGQLFAEASDRIVRYELRLGEIAPSDKPQPVLSHLPMGGAHPMHPLAIDALGNLFVSVGSATDACSPAPHEPGADPCTELETRAGIWRYSADKLDQIFSPKERYTTGMRNAEGLDFAAAGNFFATQHGRGHLHENWPQIYTTQQGFELPSEELTIVKEGRWYSWPMCYFDPGQERLLLAPEYGGDGKNKVGPCAKREMPIATFPAHWAPNDLKIYKASAFPSSYRDGAFIAFHGSWNPAGPRGGYNVVFQPLVKGKPSGPFFVFADGFAGRYKEPERATHRPSGLAVAPDGALFISDDKAGRIWRVTYIGPANQS
jgi:glucose/arabinose dehydrogenase